LDGEFANELGERSTWFNTTFPNRYKGVVSVIVAEILDRNGFCAG